MKRLGLLVGVPLLCTACGLVDLEGLDLVNPGDARAYVTACARSATDVYCKAMLPALRAVSGDVSVLLVNAGDDDRTAAIQAELQKQGLNMTGFVGSAAADRFARANIFLAPKLSTGTMTTLDGMARTVNCTRDAASLSERCVIDGRVSGHDRNEGRTDAVGSVYVTQGILPF